MIGTVSHLGFNHPGIGPIDSEEIVVDGTTKTLTAAKVNAAVYAFLRHYNGPSRATDDPLNVPIAGVIPAGYGVAMFDGDNFVLNKPEMRQFKITRQAASANGFLHVIYYGLNQS